MEISHRNFCDIHSRVKRFWLYIMMQTTAGLLYCHAFMSKILLQQAKRTTPAIVPALRWLSSRGNYDQKSTLHVYQVSGKYRHFREPATAFFYPKVGAVGSSETLVLISRTTWGHHCENLKSHFTIKWHTSSIWGHPHKVYCIPCFIYVSDNMC